MYVIDGVVRLFYDRPRAQRCRAGAAVDGISSMTAGANSETFIAAVRQRLHTASA
jgi:hypothetical protein